MPDVILIFPAIQEQEESQMPRYAARRTMTALVTASLAVIAAPAAGAHAATPTPRAVAPGATFALQNQATQKCLSTDPDNGLFTTPCRSNDAFQTWVYTQQGGIMNVQTQFCIENLSRGDVGMAGACEADYPPQQWVYKDQEKALINGWDKTCIADSDGYIYMTGYDGYPAERWTVQGRR